MAASLCSVGGCEKPARTLGMCNMHHQRVARHGDPNVLLRPQKAANPTCSEEGCSRSHRALGLCDMHWQRNRVATTDYRLRQRAGNYMLSVGDFNALLVAQEGKCAVCGADDSPLRVDHDHRCCPGKGSCGGCVRGLLCHNCNTSLGLLADDPNRLLAAAAYLMTHEKVMV